MHEDILRVEKQYLEKEKWARLEDEETFPLFNAGKHSGVLPVKHPTEIPDPDLKYKLLFEVTENNPDSAMNTLNSQLVEVARILNLHIASGIPLQNITAAVVVHGPVLAVLTQNNFYLNRYKVPNPNLKLISQMARSGVKFIACGQALQFFEIPAHDLAPEVRVSLTAQTVLSSYRLKGFVLMELK